MGSKKRKRIGVVLTTTAIAVLIAIGAYFRFSLSEKFIDRYIQKSVLRMDREMQQLIAKGLNHEELDKTHTGLFVFMNDTLVFWNRNDASPRLMKRKVTLAQDTICRLLTADYYVKSYESGSMKYYVFKTLNTSYPFENQYFEPNCKAISRFIKAKLDFETPKAGQTILNSQGKTLTHCKLIERPSIRVPYNLWWIPLAGIGIVGLVLTIRKPASSHKK